MDQRPVAVYTNAEGLDIEPGVAALEAAGFAVRVLWTTDPAAIAEGAADADALLVGYAPVGRDLLAALPRVGVVALLSMGFDNVDLTAAEEHGTWVTNVPGVATQEVATHCLALALAAARQLPAFDALVRAGGWTPDPGLVPERIGDQTFGLVGLGRIGTELGRMASAVWGTVLGHDPLLPDDAPTRERLAAAGIERVGLEELLAASDVVSLHVPLTPATHHLVDAAFLARLRPGATLVNASRGELLDSAAVRAALDSGGLRAAALDVLDQEPPDAGHPLVGHPSVIITPHVGYLSSATRTEYVRVQAQNAIAWLEQGEPRTPVNRPAAPRRSVARSGGLDPAALGTTDGAPAS